jgi:hypothetical protein
MHAQTIWWEAIAADVADALAAPFAMRTAHVAWRCKPWTGLMIVSAP